VVGSLPVTAAPLPPLRGTGPTRRGLLAAGLVLPLAGCTGSSPGPAPSPASSLAPSSAPPSAPSSAPAAVDPDVALRAAAVERELALLAAYDDVLADAAAPALLALRAEHAEHLAALDPAVAVPAAPVARERRGPSPRATTRLRAAEREAAAAHVADALPASRALAPLLASLAAAEAAHGVVLA